MPNVTTDGTSTERRDLKTAPPDGYVVIRRMTWGEFTRSRQMSSNLKVDAGQGKGFAGVMELMNQQAMEFEFANCIVDHNLTDENDRKLDFRKPADIHRLQAPVGQEIQQYISELNQFDEDSDGVNLEPASEQVSSLTESPMQT